MTTMTDSRALEVLAAHNEWRRGGDGPQTEPVTLGLALDRAIARLREPAGVGGEFDKMIEDMALHGTGVLRVEHVPHADFHAPQPPAEAQPVAWRILWSPDFPETCELTSDGERVLKVQALDDPPYIQPLYAAPAEAQAQGGGEVRDE